MSYLEDLAGLQNADGGWSYHTGGSWAEPTCFAVLALAATEAESTPAVRRGVEWLRRCQRPDGGIAPRESVAESTWLTALPLLWPASLAGQGIDRKRAAEWVLAQSGRESGWVYRLRLWMLGGKSDLDLRHDGWAWYPGAAAWVSPTAFSLLALRRLGRQGYSSPSLTPRMQQGQAYLLDRRCRDGGWNHGSTRALGYDSDSYPESTGLALLALAGARDVDLSRGISRAEQHLVSTQSREAVDWLRLGLMAHGRKPPASQLAVRRGTMQLAMAAIAEAAGKGRNVFLEA